MARNFLIFVWTQKLGLTVRVNDRFPTFNHVAKMFNNRVHCECLDIVVFNLSCWKLTGKKSFWIAINIPIKYTTQKTIWRIYHEAEACLNCEMSKRAVSKIKFLHSSNASIALWSYWRTDLSFLVSPFVISYKNHWLLAAYF